LVSEETQRDPDQLVADEQFLVRGKAAESWAISARPDTRGSAHRALSAIDRRAKMAGFLVSQFYFSNQSKIGIREEIPP